MSKKRFECIQCGNCCRQMAICISNSDILRWQEQDRIDILTEVAFSEDAPTGAGFYFPRTIVAPKAPCHFLKDNGDGKHLCSIHDTKPRACKDAPDSLDKFDVCPVWNKSYIVRKRLVKLKQRQTKDFKRCVTNFKALMDILYKAYEVRRDGYTN